jgi:hypothetical protein
MKNLNSDELQVVLTEIGACREAKDWCKGKTSVQAWAQCQRKDWMLWVEGKLWNWASEQWTEYEAKCKPIKAEYKAKRKPFDDEYWAKRKPFDDENEVSCADLLRSIVPNPAK